MDGYGSGMIDIIVMVIILEYGSNYTKMWVMVKMMVMKIINFHSQLPLTSRVLLKYCSESRIALIGVAL
jgi:hypothetical protein